MKKNRRVREELVEIDERNYVDTRRCTHSERIKFIFPL